MIGETLVVAVAKPAAVAAAKGATNLLVKSFMEKVVIPYFSGKKSKAQLVKSARTYYRNMEARTKYVPSIAIQGGKFVLESVYEPLELISDQSESSIRISGYPYQLFDAGRCILVVDYAGMGKSTITKYIFRCALKELQKIPILIELRRVKDDESLLDLICFDFVGDVRGSVRDELILAMEEGNFVIFLDGYDELSPSVRQRVSEEISRLSAEFQYCNFVLTSRPDPALTSFAGYLRYDIADLSRDEAFSLLRRYDDGRGVAENLISKISSMPAVDEFLRIPLLVTLLYKAFDYKAVVPIKKNIFYRQVFDALYQDHDLSKEGAFERRKRSNLDIEEFHRFMRSLGFMSFRKGVIQYSQEEFSLLVDLALKQTGLKTDAAGLRSDLVSAVPLFVRESNEYRWSHKSFQDYFSAQFIYFDSGSDRDELIKRMFFGQNVQRYSSLLSLLFEIDHGLVSDMCILPFVEKCCGEAGDGFFEDPEMDMQFGFISGMSDVFAVQSDGKHPVMDEGYFDRIDELVGPVKDVSERKWRRFSRLGNRAPTLIATSDDGIQRAELIGDIVGYRRSNKRVKNYAESIDGLGAFDGVLDLVSVVKEAPKSDLAISAFNLMQVAVNTWIPTLVILDELKRGADARRSIKSSFSIFDGIC
ncbi:NACHT domain-containing protein [Stenotrophomonas sp. Iso1]|uniref:NACHT domain-containing protein n=1 Tax=Stenotrophomonas sp. Iso1 TaxID=2977283 RepID=UPI0022B7CF17|nr:NACHT domain-containing protein [Stenotrophomonas sp. Iso1]